MAADIQDWTQAVTVDAGSVTILGTADVQVTNTPAVTISGTPAVSISGTPTVSIGNTPSVTISGTPTVVLGGGVATIGSISAIGSTVTVAGTVSIGNTPSVSITGTPTVNIGNSPTVSISGTPNVNIASQSGNLSIVFAATQNVNIANTPAVTISSGSVSITGTPNININSQSVNLNTQQPQTSLGNFAVAAGPANNNAIYNVPTGCHSIGFMVTHNNFGINQLTVRGQTSGTIYFNVARSPTGGDLFGYFVCPVLSVLDTQVQVTAYTVGGEGPETVYSVAILDAEGVFIFNNQGEPAATYITDSTGNPLGTAAYAGAQQLMQASLPVAIASDQSGVPWGANGRIATYSYAPGNSPFVMQAAATDIIEISNPAGSGRTLKLLRFHAEAIQTTAGFAVFNFVKHSALTTGGTSASPAAGAITKHDATDPAPVAVIKQFTANFTGGGGTTTVVRTERVWIPATANLNNIRVPDWIFGGQTPTKPIVIAPGESAALNMQSQTLGGNSWVYWLEWTEE